MEKKVLQFYLFYIFQHFDHVNKFLLSKCVWSLNFVVFRLLHQKILFFLSFWLCCKYYFLIFFLFPDFSSISLLLFYQIWTRLIFWKIILGSILWLVHNVSPLCKLEGNNWSNVTTVQVSKKTALCLWTWPTATGSFIAYCFTLFFVSRYCFLQFLELHSAFILKKNFCRKFSFCGNFTLNLPNPLTIKIY